MGAISDFVAAFDQERDKYLAIEKEVEALCKQALQGIEFLWQSRVKATKSLETKLTSRTNYKDESENVADIKDLVAGRIILARWLDIGHVEEVMRRTFNVRHRAQHPKHGQNTVNPEARFPGYAGLHFHVTRQNPLHQGSCNPVIEIQAMSAFMWGFSTLEHDVEYKRLHGLPDEDLLLTLEMLKGIANTGEIALQMYDKHFVAKLSSQQHFLKSDLQSSVRASVASVGLDENDKKCLRDLGSGLTDPRDDRKRIERHKDGLVEGLCSWVFEDPAFVDWWNHDDCRFLWIHGDPGKGETMMMMTIIDEVIERLRERAGSNVLAYFFCENTNSKLNTTVSVLRGLIFQLVDQEKTLISHLRKEHDSKGPKIFEDENALDFLLKLLSNILNDQRLGVVYIMVDALDECDADIHELLQRIINESFKLLSKVKWLATSRNELAFIEQLGHQRHTSLELNSSQVTRSVGTFIDHKIKELTRVKSYASELQESVRTALLEKSEGTFLWVALVCKELRKVRKQHVKFLLEEMPAGLKPLYARMMNKVLSQDRRIDIELCRQILCSVTLALLPLRLEEIVVFAKIPKEFYEEPSDLEDLISLCGSFITIREETVYLIHQSARDFLSDGGRKDIFPFGQGHEHANTTRLCFEVMSCTLKKDICGTKMPGICLSDINRSTIMTHLPMHVQYACRYWFDHLQRASPPEQAALVSREDCQVYVLLKRHFLHWLEALSLMNEFSKALYVIESLRSPHRAHRAGIKAALSADLCSFINDAIGLISDLYDVTSPLQLYNSALLFHPENSIIKGLLSHELPSWVKKVRTTKLDKKLLESGSDTPMTLSPNGQLLACLYNDKIIGLWDPFKGTLLRTLKGHSRGVTAVAFSHDGQLLASASLDNTIVLWDPVTGTLLRMLKGHSLAVAAVVFSHDGQLLASASWDKTVGLWDPFTGTLLRMLKGHSNWVLAVTFSHDGQLLASASDDNTIGLWDPFTGTLLRRLKGHSKPVTAVVFSHDSQLLASVSYDKAVRLWETKTQTEIQVVEHDYYGHISFKNGSRLELDGRLVDVPSFSSRGSSHEQGLTDVSYSLDRKDHWVLYQGIRVLSIPHYDSRYSYVLHGNNLVVLDTHGLNFLRLSETETPF